MGSSQLRMLVLSQSTSSSLNLLLTKHHYRYNGSPITTEGKCDEEKQMPITVFEFGHQKRIIERILSNNNGYKNCFWKICYIISLTNKHRSGFSLTFSGNILGQVIQIFFIYSFKYLTMTVHPQKIPRGPIQDCYMVTSNFLASFRKHLNRSLRK